MDKLVINEEQQTKDYNTSSTKIITEDQILLLKLSPININDLNLSTMNNKELTNNIDVVENGKKNISKIFENDRVRKYTGITTSEYEITQIYPANQIEINKFSFYPRFNKFETYEDYVNIITPYALKQNIDWIYNILDHKQEQDNILFEDDEILYIYDYKCKKDDINNFYALVFLKNKRILSIRDLESKHIILLESIKNKISLFMKNKFNIESNKLRMYFHYPPSFWHLHIHVNLFDKFYPGIQVDYCHMLYTVIQNLKLDTNYYKKINMEILNR